MRVLYVTASFPFGRGEAFIGPEVAALIGAGHQILLVPRSPSGEVLHAPAAAHLAVREALVSPRVAASAVRVAAARPAWAARCAAALLWGGAHVRLSCFAKNCSILPKAFWLAGVAESWGAEHIHAHWAGTTASLAWMAAAMAGLPWSFTAHRWDIVENNALESKIAAAAFARFISEDGLRLARAACRQLGGNVRVIRMGVPIPAVAQFRPPSRVVFLCPANLTPIKGHRFLIEAWSLLSDDLANAQLWLAGAGELDAALRSRVRELGLERSVRFLGAVPHERLISMYASNRISAVVLPSIDAANGWHEGVPVVLVEAMGYGVPVVTTPTGAIPELVAPGSGFLVPPRDSTALAGAMRAVVSDPGLSIRIGAAGRRRAIELHDIGRIAGELAGAFESARRSRRRTAPRTPVISRTAA